MYFDPKRTEPPGPRGQAITGSFATAMANAARHHGIAVVVGMLERSDDASKDYNTVLALSGSGELLGTYRKVHLYDAFGFRESDTYLPGAIDEPLIVEIAGMQMGVLTCYDLRFPEAFRWVVDAGAEIVALPSAWIVGPGKEAHWATLLGARAIENTIYVAGAGQTGPVCCGNSAVMDPTGAVLAGVGEAPGVAVAAVDADRIAAVRRRNPSLRNRRFSVIPAS